MKMLKFFTDKKWWPWSIGGTIVIVAAVYTIVRLDVMINEWFGAFYDLLQKALSAPNAVSLGEFNSQLITFFTIAGVYVIINTVFNGFLVNHWTFRWRQSMAEYYLANWAKARKVEGASQRLQEDTLKFARITESLGIGLLESILMLGAFIPVLWVLSEKITVLPIVGEVSQSLVWVVILTALGGTVVLTLVGHKLPGIEYDIQKAEAAYRKELVIGEDDSTRAKKAEVDFLFRDVKKIHFRSYMHYFYFNIAKWSYIQGMVIVPYVALAPTIVTGAITLGVVSQTSRAFGKVAESLQYVVRSWTQIVEVISVYKRLSEFESKIND
jgi:peptide/bleomycin uptake transporter